MSDMAAGWAVVVFLAVAAFAVTVATTIAEQDKHAERLDALEDQWGEVFGGPEPLSIADAATDEIPVVAPETVPAPAIDLAGGKRTRVAAAREANRARPTPFPRHRGRHSA